MRHRRGGESADSPAPALQGLRVIPGIKVILAPFAALYVLSEHYGLLVNRTCRPVIRVPPSFGQGVVQKATNRPDRFGVCDSPCRASAPATSGDTRGSLRIITRWPVSPEDDQRAAATASFSSGRLHARVDVRRPDFVSDGACGPGLCRHRDMTNWRSSSRTRSRPTHNSGARSRTRRGPLQALTHLL